MHVLQEKCPLFRSSAVKDARVACSSEHIFVKFSATADTSAEQERFMNDEVVLRVQQVQPRRLLVSA